MALQKSITSSQYCDDTEFNNFVVAQLRPGFDFIKALAGRRITQMMSLLSFLKMNLEMLFKQKKNKANGVIAL